MKDTKHVGVAGPISLSSLKPIISNFNDKWPSVEGGVPVNHLVIGLFRLGHKVSVYSTSIEINKGEVFEYHQENLSIYIGPTRRRARDRCKDLFYTERTFIKNAILRSNPTLVHAHWQYEWAWGALCSGYPTLVTCHDDPIKVFKVQRDLYRFVRLVIAIIVLKRARYLTTVSPYCQKGLKYITNKKIDVIPNFEPSSVFDLYLGNRTLSGTVKFVMINNGFTSLKNVEVGIKSFRLYKMQNPQAKLYLFGANFEIFGPAYRWCQDNKVSIDDVFFNGILPFNELMAALCTMDILLHTSKEESFGMVLVEAMAMGIPVIAGEKSGGPQWILENGGGCLVDICDTEDVLSGICRVVNEYEKFSKEARLISKDRFSGSKVISQYIKVYEQILKAS